MTNAAPMTTPMRVMVVVTNSMCPTITRLAVVAHRSVDGLSSTALGQMAEAPGSGATVGG